MKYKIKYKTLAINEGISPVQNPESALSYAADIKDDFQEHLIVVGMDIKNRVIVVHEVAKGSANTMQTHPRDIFIPLLHNLCTSFIVIHNHPSGDVDESEQDIHFTKKVYDASRIMGINMLDHIIVSGQKYNSLKKKDII